MAKDQTLGITVSKDEDISEWYVQVVQKADLAEYSPIAGCMIIKPTGYGIWEHMQRIWNDRIRELGVRNVYLPMFIPESYLRKEEDHVEGFSAEVAWIEQKEGDKERYALRPTSEAVMGPAMASWIRSHRDLPMKVNQWANIVRWETSVTRPFLRTREFLWHEGHNAFATPEESEADAKLMIDEYNKFVTESLAMPQLVGKKAESEKFPGAKTTYTIEGVTPEGKAIQNGTSHDLSDHFAQVFDITYTGDDRKEHHCYTTSWGWTTRLIGAMILLHGDNKGMVIPPRVAPRQIALCAIAKKNDSDAIIAKINELASTLQDAGVRTVVDTDLSKSTGFRFANYELEGVPLRLELGPRDLEAGNVVIARRDTGDKQTVAISDVATTITDLLETVQQDMTARAGKFLESNVVDAQSYDEFKQAIQDGKIVRCFTCGCNDCDAKVKEETAATPRVIPLDQPSVDGVACIFTGGPAKYLAYYGRSY